MRRTEPLVNPNFNGYYELVLGYLTVSGIFNITCGIEKMEELFKGNIILISRINNGVLLGEIGVHNREPYLSSIESTHSSMVIDLKKVCCHIKEVWLDYDMIKDDIIKIKGLVKPSGPNGDTLQKALDDPAEKVEFLIRSLAPKPVDKKSFKEYIDNIVTWDYIPNCCRNCGHCVNIK